MWFNWISSIYGTAPQIPETPKQTPSPRLQELARHIFKGMPCRNIPAAYQFAKRLGVQNIELKTMAVQSRVWDVVKTISEKIDFYSANILNEFHTFIVRPSYNPLVDHWSSLDNIWSKLLEVPQYEDYQLQLSYYIQNTIPQLTNLEDRAVLGILLLRKFQRSLDRTQINKLLYLLKDLFPKCSFKVQLEIFTEITEHEPDTELRNWIWKAILVSSVKQNQFSLDNFYILCIFFSDKITEPQSELVFDIIYRFSNLVSDLRSLRSITDGNLEAIHDAMRMIFSTNDELYNKCVGTFFLNLITSFHPHVHKLQRPSLWERCRVLINFFNTKVRSDSFKKESFKLLLVLEEDLKVNLKIEGSAPFAPEKGHYELLKEITKDSWLYQTASGIGNDLKPKRTYADIQQPPWIRSFQPRKFQDLQNKKKNLELEFIELIFDFDKLYISCEKRIQDTLITARSIYQISDETTKKEIRFLALKFYTRISTLTTSNDNRLKDIALQIIQQFELNPYECNFYCIQLLDNFAKELSESERPMVINETVQAVLFLSHTFGWTYLGLLVNHILNMQILNRESGAYILGFALPTWDYLPSIEVATMFKYNESPRLSNIYLMLQLPQLNEELKQIISSKLRGISLYHSVTQLIPLLKPFMRHCVNDPVFTRCIEPSLWEILNQAYQYLNLYEFSEGINRSRLAFVGLIPGDFTIEDLFTVFFKNKSALEKRELKDRLTRHIFLNELEIWMNHRRDLVKLHELSFYYHFYMSLHAKVYHLFPEDPSFEDKWFKFIDSIENLHKELLDDLDSLQVKIELEKMA